MSRTKVDMPKVTQMLDAGWLVRICKNSMGSYTACAFSENKKLVAEVNEKILEVADMEMQVVVRRFQEENFIETDDLTPAQALTRLAYKVHGEII